MWTFAMADVKNYHSSSITFSGDPNRRALHWPMIPTGTLQPSSSGGRVPRGRTSLPQTCLKRVSVTFLLWLPLSQNPLSPDPLPSQSTVLVTLQGCHPVLGLWCPVPTLLLAKSIAPSSHFLLCSIYALLTEITSWQTLMDKDQLSPKAHLTKYPLECWAHSRHSSLTASSKQASADCIFFF